MFRLYLSHFSSFSYNSSSPLRTSSVIFTAFPLLRFSTSVEPQSAAHSSLYQLLVHNHHFSPRSASKIASVATPLRNPDISDSVVSFLKQAGFSNSQLEKMVKAMPRLLSMNLEKVIKPKLKIFQDFGLSASDVINIISRHPSILSRSAHNRLRPSLSTLKTLFGANGFAKLLGVGGWFLMSDLDKSLVPNVEFLRRCGLSMDRIKQMAHSSQRTLLCKPMDMKKFVEWVDEMGVRRSSKMFIHAVIFAPSLLHETWNIKKRTFRELGLLDDGIAATFRRFPQLFGLSEKTLKHKFKIIKEMGFSDCDIGVALRKCPQLFGYSKETLKISILSFKEMGLSDDDITATFRKFPSVFGLKLETLKLKVRNLKELGFSDGDIVAVVKKTPTVFLLSVEKIKRTKEVLLENGKYNMSCIIRNPVSLGFSIEKRYKPRLQVLESLEGKNLIHSWPPFTRLFQMTDQKFHEKYVAPFLAEIDVYKANSASRG